MNSHVPTFSGIDPSYALPDNVAVITLQVSGGGCLMSGMRIFQLLVHHV